MLEGKRFRNIHWLCNLWYFAKGLELEVLAEENVVLKAEEEHGAIMTFREWEAFGDGICNRIWQQLEFTIVGEEQLEDGGEAS